MVSQSCNYHHLIVLFDTIGPPSIPSTIGRPTIDTINYRPPYHRYHQLSVALPSISSTIGRPIIDTINYRPPDHRYHQLSNDYRYHQLSIPSTIDTINYRYHQVPVVRHVVIVREGFNTKPPKFPPRNNHAR